VLSALAGRWFCFLLVLLSAAAGKFVVVLDDEDRENEGDLIINADKVSTEAMAFMVEHTSGVVSDCQKGVQFSLHGVPTCWHCYVC
jgi:3,4-dihydroxy 2-butanone 4-phosphate synthase/GTP cyclohydrolase II